MVLRLYRVFVTEVKEPDREPDIEQGIKLLICWLEKEKVIGLKVSKKSLCDAVTYQLDFACEFRMYDITPSGMCNVIIREEHNHPFVMECYKFNGYDRLYHLVTCYTAGPHYSLKADKTSRTFENVDENFVFTDEEDCAINLALNYIKKDKKFDVYCTYRDKFVQSY